MSRLLLVIVCALSLSSCGKTYNLVFNDVSGINAETEVHANGMKVGEVKKLYLLPEGNILVKIEM